MAVEGGLKLDDVELIVELGAGGSGRVFAGYDRRLNRRVAVKVLDTVVDDAQRERFDAECQHHGPLSDHDHIVTVYRAGYTADSRPYLEMELIDGGSLLDHLRTNGSVPWRQAVEWVLPICDAVTAVHERGVLHRDLKPANILLSPKGPKLADFGIACLRDESDPVHSLSVQHAPPEAIDNKRDVRSDVYSLASTLYELVAGQAPLTATAPREAVSEIIAEAPVPRIGSALAPDWLNDLLIEALAKDPAARPQTMAAFAERLTAGLAAGSSAPPTTSSSTGVTAGPRRSLGSPPAALSTRPEDVDTGPAPAATASGPEAAAASSEVASGGRARPSGLASIAVPPARRSVAPIVPAALIVLAVAVVAVVALLTVMDATAPDDLDASTEPAASDPTDGGASSSTAAPTAPASAPIAPSSEPAPASTTTPGDVAIGEVAVESTVGTGRIIFITDRCTTARYTLDDGEVVHLAPGWPDAEVRCWTDHGHTFTDLEADTGYVVTVTVRDERGEEVSVGPISFRTAAPTAALSIVPPSEAEVVVGETNSWQLVAQGGSGSFTWSSLSLPAGYSLSESGLLEFTPTSSDPVTVRVRVADQDTAETADASFTIVAVEEN